MKRFTHQQVVKIAEALRESRELHGAHGGEADVDYSGVDRAARAVSRMLSVYAKEPYDSECFMNTIINNK